MEARQRRVDRPRRVDCDQLKLRITSNNVTNLFVTNDEWQLSILCLKYPCPLQGNYRLHSKFYIILTNYKWIWRQQIHEFTGQSDEGIFNVYYIKYQWHSTHSSWDRSCTLFIKWKILQKRIRTPQSVCWGTMSVGHWWKLSDPRPLQTISAMDDDLLPLPPLPDNETTEVLTAPPEKE